MTDIRNGANLAQAATINTSHENDINDLFHTKDPVADLLQTLTSLPEAGARALLERLKQDGSIPAEILKSAEDAFNKTQSERVQQPNDPVLYSANRAATTARRGEYDQGAMLQRMQLQNQFAAMGPTPSLSRQPVQIGYTPEIPNSAGLDQAKAAMDANFVEIHDLGKQISEGKGPATDAEMKSWDEGNAKLRQSMMEWAGRVAHLPAGPEREAAAAELNRLNSQVSAAEMQVLARANPEFGESWNRHHSKAPGSDGAALPTRMKMYGISEEQMNEYIATGKESPGMSRAIADAKRKGEWPALGVVRAAYQMRADFLRATSPKEDVASFKQAQNLDAAASSLTRNRAAIQLNHSSNSYSKLVAKYPDEATRPPMVSAAIKEAKTAVSSVGEQAAKQIEAHPERYGNKSATRRLAGDAMRVEARMMESEAKASMHQQAKKLEETTKAQGDSKVVAPPPPLHSDLAEGGAVDKKRAAAVKIDPSLGDVVNGGDRAVSFAREGMQTRKLRLNIDEQQVAHLTSKNQDVSPELTAKVNKQVQSIHKSTLETHQKLVSQKPGSLSLTQTQLLTETGNDANTFSRKIGIAERQKKNLETAVRLTNSAENQIHNTRIALDGQFESLQRQKIDRVRNELAAKRTTTKNGFEEYNKFDKDPVAYIKDLSDTKQEADYRAFLNEAKTGIDEQVKEAQKRTAEAKKTYDQSKKADDLDGLNTPAEMAASQTAEALKKSEAHLKAIPEKGPERLPRMKMLMDHQSAVIGVQNTIRDNADARIQRTNLEHQQTLQVFAGETHIRPGENPVEVSKANLAKVTADGMQEKRAAFDAAKTAGAESERVRQSINKELDQEQSKLPKQVQQQQSAEVQTYKDALAAQQVRTHGAIAEMGADLNPKESLAQLDQGNRIVSEELPVAQVARLDKKQAAIDHARNEARADALATLGETGMAIARRAQTQGGIEYGTLVVDALDRAGKNASEVHRTLNIDGGGAAEATASKEFHKETKARADETLNGVMEMNKNADVNALADRMEKEIVKDLQDFEQQYGKLSKAVKDQRSGAFGFLFNTGAKLRGLIDGRGGDANKMAVEAGQKGLDFAASNARSQAHVLQQGVAQLREMKRQGIPDHVIMSALRDPRLGTNILKDGEQKFQKDLGGWRDEFNAGVKRFGSNFEVNLTPFNMLRSETPLGKVLETSNSNRTDRIVDILSHKNTDLLSRSKTELQGFYDDGQKQWRDVSPYVMLSNAPDQVLMTLASSYTFAGVFARAASFTRIPQAFSAARGMAAGMSAPARLAVLGGVNAAETGLGIATGEAISKIGTGVFGKDSTGAKAFDVIGSGFQLSVASKVALRSGLGFQAAMGLTMHGVPVAAQQLGASPELAAQIGMATGAFVPSLLGTMGNMKTLKTAESVMVNHGVDPKTAKGMMGEIFHAESLNGGTLNVESFTRERAGRLIDARLPQLGKDARADLLDAVTVESVRKNIPFEPPAGATPQQLVREVETHFGRVQTELINKGVPPDRAKELVASEKTTMYEQTLAKTNSMVERDNQTSKAGSRENPAETRMALEQIVNNSNGSLPEVQVLRSVKGEGGGQKAETGYKLVQIDHSTNSAWVMNQNGSMKEVPANNVVFVHDNQALGLMKPAIKAQFDRNLNALSDAQKVEWSNMLGEAHKKSPEHVQLLRQLLAGGSNMEDINSWHDWAKTKTHEELGTFVTPGSLPQHLTDSCVATCAQRIDALLNPKKAAELKDPRFQAAEQWQVLHRNQGGAEPRQDAMYPNRNAPPLQPQHWIPAHPDWNRPYALDAALTQEGKVNYSVYDMNILDRRYVPMHMEQLATNGGAIVQGFNPHTNSTTALEIRDVRPGPHGNEVSVRVVGQQRSEWVPVSDLQPWQDGKIRLMDGTEFTHVAAHPDMPLKRANDGMILVQDPQIQNMVRAATGKGLAEHQVEGEQALLAIEASIKDVGFAGVVVRWKNTPHQHQILVIGAKETNGQMQYDVFDPTLGYARPMTGAQLLEYSDGHGVSDVKFVQVPDDQMVSPTARSIPSANTVQINLNSLNGTSIDQTVARFDQARTPADVDAILATNLPDFATANAQTRENLINLILGNPDRGARKALLEIAPLLTDMPPAAAELAMVQLNGMMPADLVKTAQRMRNSQQPNWHRTNDEDALTYAQRVFGR